MGGNPPPLAAGTGGRGFRPRATGAGDDVPSPSRFRPMAEICRCGGLIAREGKPTVFLHTSFPFFFSSCKEIDKMNGVRRGRTLAPVPGAQSLHASPLRTPGRAAPSVDWCGDLLRRFGRGGGGSRMDKGTGERTPVYSLCVSVRCRSACLASTCLRDLIVASLIGLCKGRRAWWHAHYTFTFHRTG